MKICDPHFHMWDLPNVPNPNLGSDVKQNLPTYLATDYEADVATLPADLQLTSRIHVETIVGQKEGEIIVDSLAESRWVYAQLEPSMDQYISHLVAYVHLARDTAAAERIIEQHADASDGKLCGVRMILNHHPQNPELTWPQVESGDIMSSALFREGLKLLDSNELAFDLSCNPHQIADAVKLFGDFPDLHVITNHLGFLHDSEGDAHEDLWRQGLHALAILPNVYIKLSMLWFARNGFHSDDTKHSKVKELVREVIEIFGTNRCMFASNYPVDKVMGIDFAHLYQMFFNWTEDLTEAERKDLFHDTAHRAYKLP